MPKSETLLRVTQRNDRRIKRRIQRNQRNLVKHLHHPRTIKDRKKQVKSRKKRLVLKKIGETQVRKMNQRSLVSERTVHQKMNGLLRKSQRKNLQAAKMKLSPKRKNLSEIQVLMKKKQKKRRKLKRRGKMMIAVMKKR